MHVYILYSETLGRYYAGHSQDVINRLAEHNAGEGLITLDGAPWLLVTSVPCRSRPEAVRLEMSIKARGIDHFLHDCGINPIPAEEPAM